MPKLNKQKPTVDELIPPAPDSNEPKGSDETPPPPASLSADWITTAGALFPRKFFYGDIEHTIGNVPVTALEYLIAYGARQSGGDTAAAFGAFVGELANGDKPKQPWTEKERSEALAEMVKINPPFTNDGVAYDDKDMDHRKRLGEFYFQIKTAEKWQRIVDGKLTVEGRQPKLSLDEQTLFNMAEIAYNARMEKKSEKKSDIIAKAKLIPENNGLKNDAVWRWVINTYLKGNKAKFDKQLAEMKAKQAEPDDDEVDVDFTIITPPAPETAPAQ